MSKTNKSNQHFKVKALHYDEEQSFLRRMLDVRFYMDDISNFEGLA